jgi:hypothetical protein
MSRPITDIRRRGSFLLPLFQHRTNRVLRTPHKNVRHLHDLRKTAFTIEGIENAATKPNRHPQVLPALRNSAPLYIPAFSTEPYHRSWVQPFLVGRHERRLKKFCRTLAGFRTARGGNIAITFALATLPIIGFVGAAVDYSRANSVKAAMQTALDSTALMLSKEAVLIRRSVEDQRAEIFHALFTKRKPRTSRSP